MPNITSLQKPCIFRELSGHDREVTGANRALTGQYPGSAPVGMGRNAWYQLSISLGETKRKTKSTL